MADEIYLDNNATTRPLPEVIEAIVEVMSAGFGNASSAHSAGERARVYLERSRAHVAEFVGASPEQITFTSGGTEANNMALASVLSPRARARRVVTTEVEHSSILRMCEHLEDLGVEVVRLGVDRAGHISLEELDAALRVPTGLVSLQWVNNETGVVQDVVAAARICASRGAHFHTDAAQAVGKTEVDVGRVSVDFLSFTGHKFHGPQGVGVLYSRKPRTASPVLWGGSQEDGLRPGTENLPGIVGLATACSVRAGRLVQVVAQLAALRDAFEAKVLAALPGVHIIGDQRQRVCNSTSILFSGVDGQALVAQLDVHGVRCSQSSACTSMRPEPSYVLRAMGLSSDEAYASVRFSFAETNTASEVDRAVAEIVRIVTHLKSIEPNVPKGAAKQGAM